MEFTMAEIIIVLLCTLLLAVGVVILINILKRNNDSQEIAYIVRNEVVQQQSVLRQEISTQIQTSVKSMGDMINENQRNFSLNQSEKLSQVSQNQSEKMSQIEERLKTFSLENEQKLENIRQSVEKKLTYLQQDNNHQLEEMRKTVDEKLQKTLEDKMTQSFSLVNQRLEQVYKGLGEMQNLAVGVGDLKKVLSNVKTRGILGEIQLGSILAEILSTEQYEENVVTKKGSKERVEFAIKLPAEDDGFIYLPIDSKFPGDTYAALRDAIDEGDKEKIEIATKLLVATIKKEAKDIRDKYIDPPHTTEFAIMFLPFEGLYSEVVNRGLVEILQREYKVNIAGPSTMAALLNSLQMGFKTLAVQKRSAEVWEVLAGVKQEFDKFNDVLEKTKSSLEKAQKDMDSLIGVRTRQIQRKLKNVQSTTTAINSGLDDEDY